MNAADRSQGEQRPPRRDGPFRILVFHHTHWDREWWATYQEFRIRLVQVVDELMAALDADPAFRSFLLDCQTVVLRDYLAIRPENRERLLQYIRSGRIECGPWYILPDEFLVSGEAHVRNMWLGRRAGEDLEIPLLSVGYIPDTFGHIGQMPQILRGFGIDNAFLWRGRGGSAETVKQEFLWEAPDGSTVLAHWFPDGYYWMPFFHFGDPDYPEEEKIGRVRGSVERWAARATTDTLLMPYGGDHRHVDTLLAQRIQEANEGLDGLGTVEWSTLEEYLSAVRKASPELETVAGELRTVGPDSPHVLPGVLSTRLYLKRLNDAGQRWLERYAEPLSALAWAQAGARYDYGLIWTAWELLVQNHPHDSICGCSIDQVHREMIPRFDQSRQIAKVLAAESARALDAEIDTSGMSTGETPLVVHNTLPWRRSGWASVWIDRQEIEARTHVLRDDEGHEVAFVARDVEGLRWRDARWLYTEVAFLADAVPGLGYRTYSLGRRDTPLDLRRMGFNAVQATAALKGSEATTDLFVGSNVLENAYLRVEVDASDGTFSVTHKESGETYRGLNAFEDGGDAGDEYNYSQPLNDTVLRSTDGARVHVSVAEAGYSRATLRVEIVWALPACLTDDRLGRADEYVETRITSLVTLLSRCRYVEVETDWVNGSSDHRLRALFPLGTDVDASHAEGQFEVVHRKTALPDPGRGWPEVPVTTMPQQGWVSVEQARRSLTIANRGLPEYEVLRDGQGTLALTLLRAVGWLSRNDLLSREGGAGPTMQTPEAQMIGPVRASYAVIPHVGDWLASRSYRTAHEYRTPLYGSDTGIHSGRYGLKGGVVDIQGDHTLVMSACKKAESGNALVLRFWNVARERTRARAKMTVPSSGVHLVDLREEPLPDGAIQADADGCFDLEVGPAGIVTVAVTV